MTTIYQTPPIVVATSRDNASLIDHNNTFILLVMMILLIICSLMVDFALYYRMNELLTLLTIYSFLEVENTTPMILNFREAFFLDILCHCLYELDLVILSFYCDG
jgi:hypothetical protein